MQQKIFLHLKQLASTQKKLKYSQRKYITFHALSSKVVSGKKLNNKKQTRNSNFFLICLSVTGLKTGKSYVRQQSSLSTLLGSFICCQNKLQFDSWWYDLIGTQKQQRLHKLQKPNSYACYMEDHIPMQNKVFFFSSRLDYTVTSQLKLGKLKG